VSRQTLPLARTTDLNIEIVGSETLIYDHKTDKAYVLNSTAAAVWRASNGTRTVQEIAAYLSAEKATDEQTVWYALGQMQELLDAQIEMPQSLQRISRRQFLKRAGLVASAAAIPVVVSVVAPAPVHAQSVTSFACNCLFADCFEVTDCETQCAEICSGFIACCGPTCGCT
jgi:hypothetical protein